MDCDPTNRIVERLLFVASNLPHAQVREVAATQVLCLSVNRPVWQEVFTVSSPIINLKEMQTFYWVLDEGRAVYFF